MLERTMFTDIERLSIRVIADEWSKETGRSADLHVASLIKLREEILVKEHGEDALYGSPGPSEHAYILKAELRQFCEEYGELLPRFWFGTGRTDAWKLKRLQAWFDELIGRTDRPPTKEKMFKLAKAELGNQLGRKIFDKVWKKNAPSEWKAKGRRKETHPPKI
jgi:hypothetical protein